MNEIMKSKEMKKRFLKRYKRNLACLNRLENQLFELDEKIKSISSPKISDMPRGGIPITNEDLICKKLELEERINNLNEKGKRLRKETYDIIDSLDNPKYIEVLELYLIESLDFEEIADRLNYTVRHIIRLYSEAIMSIYID